MSKGWKERQSYWQSRHRCGKCGKEDAYTMAGRKRCAECCDRERAWRAANKSNPGAQSRRSESGRLACPIQEAPQERM